MFSASHIAKVEDLNQSLDLRILENSGPVLVFSMKHIPHLYYLLHIYKSALPVKYCSNAVKYKPYIKI